MVKRLLSYVRYINKLDFTLKYLAKPITPYNP